MRSIETMFRSWKADVLLSHGKVEAIGHNLVPHPSPSVRVIDAKDKYVMPGGIDTHTHLQLPFMGTVAVDDFDVGTQAAVAGGTTCLCRIFLTFFQIIS